MPISRNWQPGGVIGRQPSQTRTPVAAKPRGGRGANKIDLNTCTLEQLQNLPGVGAAMGAHIMAGRPYRNFDDLARDGVPLNTIEQIRGLVTVGP
jgi:DNA uptake protein ComE-like DNA-binding protein